MTMLAESDVAVAVTPERPGTRIPWRRLLAETLVIMGSILAAFTVDRWWDSRTEHRETAVALRALLV